MDSKLITKLVIRDCMRKNHIFTIPNVIFGNIEMDVFSVTRAEKVYEFEVKISRSDYLADFKKVTKHRLLKEGKYWANKFIYVVPEGLIQPEEVPDYAGLYYLKYKDWHTWEFVVVKRPPWVNKDDNYTFRLKELTVKVYHRYIWNFIHV